MIAAKEYVSNRDGAWRLVGTRVSLDSLVYLYQEGLTPEAMVESYPTLTLEQIHGALAFYLANRAEVDAYLRQGEREAQKQATESARTNADFIAKLKRARHADSIPG